MFYPYIKDYIKSIYRLLILNRYGSHVTPKFDLFYKDYYIITLYILLHSLYLLQPLNVSCFAVLKCLYKQ